MSPDIRLSVNRTYSYYNARVLLDCTYELKFKNNKHNNLSL